MRKILRSAVATLLASGILGLARPAIAQAPMTPIASPSIAENVQPAPKPAAPRILDARDNELRLPTVGPAKPPPPVMKWGQPAMSWESEVQKKPDAKGNAPKKPVVKPAAKPVKKSKPDAFASQQQPASTGVSSPALTVPVLPRRWQRPVTSEESEPRAEPPAKPAALPVAKIGVKGEGRGTIEETPSPSSLTPRPSPPKVTMPAQTSAVRPDRPSSWPPAYNTQPPGRPGVIVFDDEPERRVAKAPVVSAELKRQVKSVCGRQARDVLVETQRDGSMLVKVKMKATNAATEDKLTRRILAMPEMTAPNVRLLMDIEP